MSFFAGVVSLLLQQNPNPNPMHAN